MAHKSGQITVTMYFIAAGLSTNLLKRGGAGTSKMEGKKNYPTLYINDCSRLKITKVPNPGYGLNEVCCEVAKLLSFA